MDLRAFVLATLVGSLLALPAPPAAHAANGCPDNLEQAPPLMPCGGLAADGTASDAAVTPDPGAVPAGLGPRTTLGNPVSLVTGTKFQQEIDFDLPGTALTFRRHYSSADGDTDIGLGFGWRHTFAVALHSRGDDALEISDSRGRRLRFERAAAEGDGRQLFRTPSASDGYLERGETAGAGGRVRERTVWHLPDGRTLGFHGSYLVRLDWPDQRALSLVYRERRPVSITDQSGRVLRLEYAAGPLGLGNYERAEFQSQSGHLAALVLPDGRRVEYDYDAERNLSRARFADGTARRYLYEDALWPHHLTGLTDRSGRRFATWAYDDWGRAVRSEHAGGVERVTLAYEEPATVGDIGRTVVTDSEGATSTYTWRREPDGGRSQLLSARGAGCASCPPTAHDYAYDAAGRLASDVRLDDADVPIRRVRHEHDAQGRLARTTLVTPAGTTRLLERREYAGTSPVPQRIARPSVHPDGERVTETRRDAYGRVTSITERGFSPRADGGHDPIARITTFAHDDGGHLIAIDGPREDVADVTRLDWDKRSRLVAIRPPASPAIRLDAFDALGRPGEIRVGGASPYRLGYDARGAVASVAWRGLSLRYEHDAEGRLTATVDTDGRRTTIAHDAAGRPERLTDDFGRVSTLVHDTESRVRERSLFGLDGQLVRSIAYAFDARGRLVAATERRGHPSGEHETRREVDFAHDASGNLTGASERAIGATTSSAIDPLRGLATFVAADGTTTDHAFDALGQPIAFTDARGNTTRTLVDDFGRTVQLDSPDTGRERYAYDPAGHRVRREHADGHVTTYVWDAAGRLAERRDPDGVTRFRHDAATGQLAEASNAASVERFEHDAEGQLVRHERELDGRRYATLYRHDERGRLAEKTLPDGQRLRYHYHESGPNRGTLRAITRERLMGLAQETVLAEA